MATIKDPKLDPNKMIENADYQVKARDAINNYGSQYGITNDMVGWNQKSGMITLGGSDFLKPDKVENGSSWISNDVLRSGVDNYAKQRGIQSNEQKYDLKNSGYDKDQYSAKIDGLLSSIMEAKPFSYDQANDPSFKSYQQQYAKAGDNALANTMSEASSMTGGRLNSWAVSAGQEAKANFDQDLMNIIPQLEQQAYSRYQGDMNSKRSDLNMLTGLDNDSYRKALDARAFDYGIGRDQIDDGRYADDKKYNRGRDALSDTRYVDETKYNRGRDSVSDTRYIDETKYSRGQDSVNRNDRLKESAIDNARQNTTLALQQQNQARNIFESDRDYQFKIDEAAKKTGADPQTLGLAYSSMMESADPVKWLAAESKYMTNDELLALQKLLPKEESSLDRAIAAILESSK